MKTHCLQCGKEIERIPSDIKEGNGKFCNRKCMGLWRAKHWKGGNNPNWKGINNLICPICNITFHIRPSEIGQRKCCSKPCYAIYKSLYHIGSNHPSTWKGGIIKAGTKLKYRAIYKPEHPRSHHGHVLEHIVIAENILGHSLPEGAVIHHINGDTIDNRPENLKICINQSEHRKLHIKEREKLCQ